jgi:hypothetical protein
MHARWSLLWGLSAKRPVSTEPSPPARSAATTAPHPQSSWLGDRREYAGVSDGSARPHCRILNRKNRRELASNPSTLIYSILSLTRASNANMLCILPGPEQTKQLSARVSSCTSRPVCARTVFLWWLVRSYFPSRIHLGSGAIVTAIPRPVAQR